MAEMFVVSVSLTAPKIVQFSLGRYQMKCLPEIPAVLDARVHPAGVDEHAGHDYSAFQKGPVTASDAGSPESRW